MINSCQREFIVENLLSHNCSSNQDFIDVKCRYITIENHQANSLS